MPLLLVHHADAVSPAVDSMRPLSRSGHDQASRVAAAVATLDFVPELIWHSSKLRARQTAEALFLGCNQSATVGPVRGLLPGDPPSWLRDQLAHESRAIALVGHFPHLPALLSALIGDERPFPLHGCVLLEPDGDLWHEVWRFAP